MVSTQVLCFLLLVVAVCGHLPPPSAYKVLPEKGQVHGVFEVSTMPLPYAFNASVAQTVCEDLGVTLATRAQVEEAHAHGLQTCRFGWVQELCAVIPRVEAQQACGKGATGVIVWSKGASALFDAFCFNTTALEMWTEVPRGPAFFSTWWPFPSTAPLLPSSAVTPVSSLTALPLGDSQLQVLLPTVLAVLGVTLLLLTAVLILRHHQMKRFLICNEDNGKNEKQAGEKDSGGHLSEADSNSNDIGLTVIPKTQPGTP